MVLMSLLRSKNVCCSFASLFLLPCLVWGEEKAPTPQEALAMKRITEYWKDGDLKTAKAQITAFLKKNPESVLTDALRAMLGDLLFQERNFAEALTAYEGIQKKSVQHKIALNQIQAFFEVGNYSGAASLAQRCLKQEDAAFKDQQLDMRFLLAESLLRQALQESGSSQKCALAQEAKTQYQHLQGSKYAKESLLPLAEIHRILGETEEAATCFLELAENHPQRAEDFLFQAATLQVHLDKQKAAQTFGKIVKLGGKRSSVAAYNQVTLLFQDQKFRDLIEAGEEALNHAPSDKQALFHFYLGWSHYALAEFLPAAKHLSCYLEGATEAKEHVKTALLCLVICAQKTQDAPLFTQALDGLSRFYPNDPQRAKALLMHAQWMMQLDHKEEAEADFETVLSQFSEGLEREGVLYDYALLLAQNGKWQQGKLRFEQFTQQFATSPHAADAWRHFFNCSLELYQQQSEDKAVFAADLAKVLNQDGVFDAKERQDYQFLLIKTLYDLEDQESLLREAHLFLNDPESSALLMGEVHVMLALQAGFGTDAFFKHAEEALKICPELSQRPLLHLQLFNAYLQQEDDDSAAHHLFSAYELGQTPKLENRLWLAEHYLKKDPHSPKGERLLTELLQFDPEKKTLVIGEDEAQLEFEVLKLADIYRTRHQDSLRVSLLEALTQLQENMPNADWKTRRNALFELGKTYETVGNINAALKTYDYLIQTSTHVPSHLSDAALLQKVRLSYTHFKDSMTEEESIAWLDALKDLQIKKRVQSEPLHLEAAIEYAEMRIAQASPEERAEKGKFFYQRALEDFTRSDDVSSADYQQARGKEREKDQLISTYLDYFQTQVLRYDAECQMNAETKQKALEEIKGMLTQETLTPFLQEKLRTAQVAIEKSL